MLFFGNTIVVLCERLLFPSSGSARKLACPFVSWSPVLALMATVPSGSVGAGAPAKVEEFQGFPGKDSPPAQSATPRAEGLLPLTARAEADDLRLVALRFGLESELLQALVVALEASSPEEVSLDDLAHLRPSDLDAVVGSLRVMKEDASEDAPATFMQRARVARFLAHVADGAAKARRILVTPPVPRQADLAPTPSGRRRAKYSDVLEILEVERLDQFRDNHVASSRVTRAGLQTNSCQPCSLAWRNAFRRTWTSPPLAPTAKG